MKRICAILLVLSISVGILQPMNMQAAKARTGSKKSDINVITIDSEDELKANYEVLDSVDVIELTQSTLEKLDFDEVKEVLDNGTDMLVSDSRVEEVEELFEVTHSAPVEEEESTVVYLTTENSDYQVLPVYAHVIYGEDEVVSDEKIASDTEALNRYLSSTTDTKVDLEESIKAEELYAMVHDENDDELLAQMTEEDIVLLQTSTLIGESFCENKRFVYFYKEGSANGTGTDYDYSSNASMEGWSKMGSMSLALYALKIKTISEVTYDNVYSVVVAAGLNDKHVKQFAVNVSVPELATNIILDQTKSVGGASDGNGKLGTSVNSNGNIPSTGYTTYAYNPGRQAVSTNFSDKHSKRWTFTPPSAIENGSWRVRPAITLKKTNGTKSSVTASVSVDYFQVSGGVRSYTIKDTVKCSVKFVNHKQA